MGGKSQLEDHPALWNYVVGRPFESVWFLIDHEYWAQDCDLEMRQHTTQQHKGIFVGWHNVKLFVIQPRDHVLAYVSVSSWLFAYVSFLVVLCS